ncbi:bifunctional metallophosphatase/5'-nucleotidase [Sulfoacidibacillus ferrooxidans]|uniref:Bifunctional metallophosphatase/5'-nucleotidase n=1 Tax=Sulfoacidibacillus ferrooxidans TaxID=2005001 RepID=A0A9X2ADW1_9BACL|nr:hypothetical protein [Sulfoacidibacillus ferrooxidans]
MELHILHTNDVHSELERFSYLAKHLRARYDELRDREQPVLCFELGDHIDMSNPLSYATAGHVNARILQTLPYDGWVFGNNETLTIDQSEWAHLIRLANVPLFCSNLTVPGLNQDEQGNLVHGQYYEIDGVKIGVFGVTVKYEKSFATLGIKAEDPVAVAFQMASEMREHGAEIVILLSHLGYHMDQLLADQGLPVDVIIGAHTHHFLDGGDLRSGIWILQAGKHAYAFGHAVLHVDENHHVTNVTSSLEYTDFTGDPDEKVETAITSLHDKAIEWLQSPVATISVPLSHSLFGESQLVNLLCDELRIELSAQLAFLNGGVITAGYLAGTIRQKDLLAICGTPMRPVKMNVPGHALLQLISEGNQEQLIRRQGFGFGFRGHFVGRLHVSGAHVTIAEMDSRESGETATIVRVLIGMQQLDPMRMYTVVTSEYIALSPMYKSLHGYEYVYCEPLIRTFLGRALGNGNLVEGAHKQRYRWINDDAN